MQLSHSRLSVKRGPSLWWSFGFCLLGLFLVLTRWSGAHPYHEEAKTQSGASVLANAILTNHPYLFEPENRGWLESLLEEDGEAVAFPEAQLVTLLESVETTISVKLETDTSPELSPLGAISLPGDRGGILFHISRGQGPVSFMTSRVDLAYTENQVSIPVASSGSTWTLLTLENVPDGLTSLYGSFDQEDGSIGAIPFQVTAPKPGRLRLTVQSDDTGEPSPAMVQLKWLFDGSLRAPDNALDFTPQFDSQASSRNRYGGSRRLDLPGVPEGDYWIVPGPVDMMIPPGQWQISILRGLEHLQVTDTVQISSGETVEKVYQPKRWTDMAAKGWYSGDDHVHAQVMSQSDADNLLTWALAEDLKVVNLLEMGDHERTYFQQRAFGADGRIQYGNTVLIPGQEDPRIGHLGHTIALNIPQPVRDTSRYYLHDWVYDRVHELGGLYGYAHVNRERFDIHRDMSLNIPKGKVDFVELLQFHNLGTRLYYDFLNLGYKVTASAGSDVPWGGTVGEVRVYAYVKEKPFISDAWFEAVGKGHTFVTDGPMIEFSVDGALPGDEIQIGPDTQTLKVKARAWGHPDRMVPTRLEIVRLGQIVRSTTDPVTSSGDLRLEFDLDSDQGFWLAARAYADDGSSAHTTPIYISNPPLRFWDHTQALGLIDQQMSSLSEIEHMVYSIGLSESGPAEGPRSGALIGQWYGNADLTRPRGLDVLVLPGQIWPEGNERGGNWSGQWKGTLTVPDSAPESIKLFLDSSGPASLSVDGKAVIKKDARGEEAAEIRLQPGTPSKITLTYANLRPPRSYLSLSWSAEGIDKQPVPSAWFSYSKQDRAAIRFGVVTEHHAIQLREQAESLLDRVEEARLIYQNLRLQWTEELAIREKQ